MSLVVWIAALGFASRQGCVTSMRRYPLVLPMALLFVIGASTNVFAQSKEAATNALATRFLKEAPAAWNRIEEQTMGLSTVVEARAGHPGKSPTEILHDPKERLEILDVCVKGDNTKRQIETPKDGKRHLSVSNANYSFTLRKNGSADSAWVVTSVTGQNQRPSSQSRWNPRSDLLFARTNVCYCRLVDLVSSPAFSVQRITEESNLVRVEFKSEFDRDKQNRIVGGWIKLNPRQLERGSIQSRVSVAFQGKGANLRFSGIRRYQAGLAVPQSPRRRPAISLDGRNAVCVHIPRH